MPLWTKTDNAAGKPKYLTDAEKDDTYLVDEDEAQQPENRARGIQNQGWVHYTTYTDSDGATRHRAETLVAFGDTTGSGDEANDAIIVDRTLTIVTQPSNASANNDFGGAGAGANTASFTVSASVDPTASITYQWQGKAPAGSFTNLSNDSTYSGVTTATLSVDVTEGLDGYQYRVVVSSSGATSLTSDAATLSVNDRIITIDTEPTGYTANTAAANTAFFNVSASIDPNTAITYEWQGRANNTVSFAALSNTVIYTGFDSANLVVNEVSGLDAWEYRVVIDATGAVPVTSNTVTLTVV